MDECLLLGLLHRKDRPDRVLGVRWRRDQGGQLGRQIADLQPVRGLQQQGAFNGVAELTHVAGPVIYEQLLQRRGGNAAGAVLGAAGVVLQKMGNQQGDVLAVFSKRVFVNAELPTICHADRPF